MSRLFHPHYVPARLFYEERWLTSRFIFSCGQRSLRGHTLVVLLLIILSTHGAGVDTTAAWDDPFKQNWIVNGDTRPGNMTGWNCINDITFQQNCTIRNGTSDTFSSRWCNGHQLGNQLSGPFVPGVSANLSCRVTQSINVLKFPRLLTYIRTGLVTMHVNATLGSDNDIARFEIQLSNDADLLAPSQALSTDFFMCMQPFYFASEVPRHTTFISATFSCWMTADGQSCDGWGSDFSVVFKVKRQITSSQTPSNRTTTLYISSTRGLTRSVNISTTHSKRLSTFVTHSGMESVTKTNAATGNSNSRSHSLSVVARYSSSLTMSIAVTNISSPSWSEIKGNNTSAPTPSSSGFLLYSKQLSNSARKLSAWMTTDQSSTLRSSISATHSAKSKSSCLFGAITPSTVPPKSTALPTTAPVTSVTSTVNVGVTAASALLGAAAGGALMQASLGAAPCANNNGETPADRSSNPAMYLVSPFYGINDYAMVFGNIALVIAAALLHLTVVVIGPRVSRRQNRSLLQNLTRFRFPTFTIQAAVRFKG
ncbi:membrane-associated protein, putative [Bodo saltans]|uniref:Membrane-associated protein, putative n=1 Tax=Bodo saltans TaxID=75058 RepID=A0A0S4KM40_BODSA|nr:membrane-associated protein, putative [Bodo saltans]|eukprot:CUI14691.1 membrane-associated protein, putative [Bodo saltans]